MSNLKANVVLDAKGFACPMPIVKTKKAMNDLEPGEVLEVQATDKGSKADIKAWAESTGHQYLGTLDEGDILRHFLRKSASDEITVERKYPHAVNNKDLQKKIEANEDLLVLDVREAAEYTFNHIPNAVSIPLGELEQRVDELSKDQDIFIICRSGTRSDLAAHKLNEKGFEKVFNVVPGMSDWSGKTTGINNEGGQSKCQ